MSEWIALSKSIHKDAYWRGMIGFRFAESMQIVEILLPELAEVVPHYVLGFVKSGDSCQLVALTGVLGRNFYVGSDSRWYCAYVPSILRCYPFMLGNNGENEKIVCIDRESISNNIEDEKMFNDEGEPTPNTASKLQFLSECDAQKEYTDEACKILLDNGVLEDWALTLRANNESGATKVSGLLRVNPEKIRSLDSEALSKLNRLNALGIAYAQLFSMNQINVIQQRVLAMTAAVKPESLDELVHSDGLINFDNLGD